MLVVPLRHPSLAAPAAHISVVPALEINRWSTSTFAAAADTSPLELCDLGEHLQLCRRSRGRLFAALCLSDSVDRFLAPRLITTMAVIAMLGALLALL